MKKAQNMPYQSRTLGAEAWYRFKKNKLALGALAIFILLALMAITTIIIDLVTNNSIYDKYVISQDLLQRLQPPSKEHILGMDEFGRDILLRIIWGTRYSLFMGAFAVLGASVLGGIIGAVAGYYNMMDTILIAHHGRIPRNSDNAAGCCDRCGNGSQSRQCCSCHCHLPDADLRARHSRTGIDDQGSGVH